MQTQEKTTRKQRNSSIPRKPASAYGKKEELSEEALEQVFRFRDLVNEYRISLFSPEIKTSEPISPKKLDQQWRLTLAKC